MKAQRQRRISCRLDVYLNRKYLCLMRLCVGFFYRSLSNINKNSFRNKHTILRARTVYTLHTDLPCSNHDLLSKFTNFHRSKWKCSRILFFASTQHRMMSFHFASKHTECTVYRCTMYSCTQRLDILILIKLSISSEYLYVFFSDSISISSWKFVIVI